MNFQCQFVKKKLEVSANPKLFDSAFTMMLHSNFNFSSGKNITKIVVRQQNKTKTYIGTNQTDDTVHTNIEHIPVCRKIYLFFASFIAILYYFYILFEPIAKFMLEFWNISLVYSITSRIFAFARLQVLFLDPHFCQEQIQSCHDYLVTLQNCFIKE